jgi:citrate lyase alpha subunit
MDMPIDKDPLSFKYFLKSGNAVAEVLDFVTILGILVLSFSLLGLVGYPALLTAQEARFTENTKQSFVVLADNVNKIALGQSPSQSVEIKLYGGRLQITGESMININATVHNASFPGGMEITLDTETMRSIENSIGDTLVAYEGTGVWVKYSDDVILNPYKPLIINQSNVLIIPVVYLSGESSMGGTGISRVTLCPDHPCSPELTSWSNVSNVTITITGNYTSGWKDYFRNMKGMTWETGGTGEAITAKLNNTKMDVHILKTLIYAVIT